MEKIDYKSLAAKFFCWGAIIGLAFLFFEYLFVYTVPFLIAWGIAYLIYPISVELSSKTKLPRKLCSFSLVLILLSVMLSLLFLIGNRLLFEAQRLFEHLTENSEEIEGYFKEIFDYFRSLREKLPIISGFKDTEIGESLANNFYALISSIWQSLIDWFGSVAQDLAADIVIALPNVLFVSLITVIACFYFALDVDALHKRIKEALPQRAISKIRAVKENIICGFKNYVKAYLILFVITFFELLAGFLILGIDYSFVLALLIAVVDFLPVFGTGAVLLPWAIVLILMKKYYSGIGMLVLFAVVTVIRQVIEPKIIGKSMGVHPLLTLAGLYIGFRLFGIGGMILAPIVITVGAQALQRKNDS